MKLLMHVLKNNPKLGVDNEIISFKDINNKLTEEFTGVAKAIVNYSYNKTLNNLKEIVRKTFDLIQVSILILWKCNRISNDLDSPGLIKEINIEHKDKLISGEEWIAETGIEIDVKE